MSFGSQNSNYPNYSAYGQGGTQQQGTGWASTSTTPQQSAGWGSSMSSGMGFSDPGPSFTGNDRLEDEPPLLEELGIDPSQIVRRTCAMLNPMRRAPVEQGSDDDVAGPLLFAFLMGAAHLMRGRMHFGYILGWTSLSTIAMYWLVNQLANQDRGEGVQLYRCGSILGYCMLPVVLLAVLSLLLPGGFVTWVTSFVLVLWCASKATTQFMRSLPHSEGKKYVVAYPCVLVYSLFALLSVY
ncbi:YIP1 family protein [bacterium]|nr:YIP1 family protein [bacterium]|tara:strand:- start:4734 stop:5453 length:720 start_codon:yes stop_codon:yes gene_type:complete